MLQGWRHKVVKILLYHDVSDLLEQPCNRSDNINKVVTSCNQFVPYLLTTWDKQCEHNLFDELLEDLQPRCEIFACVQVEVDPNI
jgi:hypothetical protein